MKGWRTVIGALVLGLYGVIVAALAIAYSWNILIAGALLAIIAAVALELMR